MRSVTLCLAAAIAFPAGAQGTLTGHVRDPNGFGVAGAEVRIAGGPVGAVTDSSGAFSLLAVPAGPATVSARRLGFRPGTRVVTVLEGQTVDITVALPFAPWQLERVMVTARREPFDSRLAGFRQRSEKRVGTFITRERIEASASATFSDLLRSVPGVRVVASSSGIRNALRFRGQDCPPLVYVDGFPASADEFDVDIIDPATVEGVEIYMSMLTVPAELNSPRGLERCGVIAVWSRPFRPKPRSAKLVPAAELQRLVESSAVYTANEVDSTARLERGSFSPLYPDSLWKAGTGGQVMVEFVVDGYGRVELEFFSVVSASHAEFADSVREALASAHFAPAIKNGRHVRQLVQLPTRFDRPTP